MMQGKIALEEHFILPSFAAYGADASALDGTTKATTTSRRTSPTSSGGWATPRYGCKTWIAAASSAWFGR
jgi:hypothetical protein